MHSVINDVKNALHNLSKETGLKTSEVRSISAKLYKTIENKNIDNVLTLCAQLLDQREWTTGVIAYDWAYRVKKQYNDKTFVIFERWLKQYVTDWGNCDDFCTHAFGELLSQNNSYFNKILEWTKHKDFFVRRAAAVILIYPINKNKYTDLKPFTIADALMNDEHHLVLKGYGWMLKVLSKKEPIKVYNYLMKHKQTMPRTAFRYALEKLNNEQKAILMEK